MSYIATTDIRDAIYADIVTSTEITESDTFFNDFALSRGVATADISTPVHYQIKQMLIYFVQMRMAEARIGIQSNIPIRSQSTSPVDIHKEKFEFYKKLFEEQEKMVTKEMIEGDADTMQEYHGRSFSVLRG